MSSLSRLIRLLAEIEDLEQFQANNPPPHPLVWFEVGCDGSKKLLWVEENSVANFNEVLVMCCVEDDTRHFRQE